MQIQLYSVKAFVCIPQEKYYETDSTAKGDRCKRYYFYSILHWILFKLRYSKKIFGIFRLMKVILNMYNN